MTTSLQKALSSAGSYISNWWYPGFKKVAYTYVSDACCERCRSGMFTDLTSISSFRKHLSLSIFSQPSNLSLMLILSCRTWDSNWRNLQTPSFTLRVAQKSDANSLLWHIYNSAYKGARSILTFRLNLSLWLHTPLFTMVPHMKGVIEA